MSKQPVIKGVRYFLAHTPGLVPYGYRPSVDLARDPETIERIVPNLRSYAKAVAYPPNRAYLGSIYPDDLRDIERPWFNQNGSTERAQPHGDIMPENEFYGMLKIADFFDLVWLEEEFTAEVKKSLGANPLITDKDIESLGDGYAMHDIQHQADGDQAIPLFLSNGRPIGCVNRALEDAPVLSANVMLENLCCKATAIMATRTLLQDSGIDPADITYVLNTGEEAVGDPYQRGGGNMAKAVAEMCGMDSATGSDVKAFCCAPVHALVLAGSLVSSGVFKQVAVLGGCSLAKLGMNYQAHIESDQPILEDVLASIAIIVGEDDGVSPVIRLDSVGSHNIGAGSSLRNISKTLISDPLDRLGIGFGDIDKFAIELQNPEITEPTGSGDVTGRNYRVIGGLAAQSRQIERDQVDDFAKEHGMPGFSSTQGHIASAIPFLGHAVDKIREGEMDRAMFIAKGSLFLGRMTKMSDGFSFILERNRQA